MTILRHTRAGFTLIEVLIAVLILALGLLGIGALFPVIIRAQQAATDETLGVSARLSAGETLLSRPEFSGTVNVPNDRTGWGVWLNDADWSEQRGPNQSLDGRNGWMQLTNTELDPDTGVVTLGRNNAVLDTVLPVGARLWPSASSAVNTPRLVWDFVGRRVDPAQGGGRQVQLAIFVRRIDPQIRVPLNPGNDPNFPDTLLKVLTTDDASIRRLPVGVNAATGAPTRDGTGVYSRILTRQVRTLSARRDVLELVDALPLIDPLVKLPDQRLVDNLGNIYTVRGATEAPLNGVRIEPPIPAWVPDDAIWQVAYTPQIPVAVRIVTVSP